MRRLFVPSLLVFTLALVVFPAHAQPDRPRGGSPRGQGGGRIDINTASLEELRAVPGIGDEYAQKIVDGRPYRGAAALMTKGVMSQAAYERVAHRITASAVRSEASGSRKGISSERDMAELAARQHPGQKWGYLKVYGPPSDTVGDTLIIKVPDSTPGGTLVELAVSHTGRERDSLWRKVRGYVRRGQGTDGLDAFEVTGVWHVANANLAKARPQDNKEFATEGWRTMKEKVPLTH